MKTKFYNLSINTIAFPAIMILYPGIIIKAQETVTDIDSNVYQTVTIGTQIWMKENLKTIHYSNGDAIPNITDTTAWTGLTTGAYCNYNNDSTKVATYGRLYNWYAVADDRNVCPAGWTVPKDADWTTLINYLGGESVAGGKMKEVGTMHWTYPNTGANNSSVFTGLPAGLRDDLAGFYDIDKGGSFWSANANSSEPSYAYFLLLWFSEVKVQYFSYYKSLGNSVRCLKDSKTDINNLIKYNEIEISPNPTTGQFTISFGTTPIYEALVEIYNLQGNLILSETFQNAVTASIDLNAFVKGIYVIKVLSGTIVTIRKINIQ
jgi:uncharacterized protein (TIGR02145 family)